MRTDTRQKDQEEINDTLNAITGLNRNWFAVVGFLLKIDKKRYPVEVIKKSLWMMGEESIKKVRCLVNIPNRLFPYLVQVVKNNGPEVRAGIDKKENTPTEEEANNVWERIESYHEAH